MFLIDAAKEYQGLGWRVLPILPDAENGTKKPPVAYENLKTADPASGVFTDLFKQYPQCTGIAKIVSADEIVIDIDGGSWPEMPITPTLQTVRGYHYHFKRPLSLKLTKGQVDFQDGMEIKGPGMLANIPPGLHPSGFQYTWIHGPETPLADLPGWITDKINKYEAAHPEGKRLLPEELESIIQGVREGEGRNKAVMRLGGHYIGKGLAWPEIETLLRNWNKTNIPPLEDQELNTCLKSLERMYNERQEKRENKKRKQEEPEEHKPETIEDKYPAHIINLAMQLLDKGNPLKFILDTWNLRHVGDRELGEVCACAVSSTHITTTQGLHVKPHGDSGKGKSDAVEKFLWLLPPDKVLNSSLSGKSPFYNPHLKKGTIIYTDDVQLNPDIITTIKQATSKYQSKTRHTTVKKQEHAEYSIPERICWMLSAVNGFDDDQLSNRFLGIDVDATQAQDRAVNQKQRESRRYGTSKETIDDSVLVCRAVFDILGQEEYKILIPYINCIQWLDIQNRRNFEMFCDILISVTFYHIKQREKYHDAYMANVSDFYTAKSIYKNFAEYNHTKLTKKETDILNILIGAKGQPVEFKEIQKRTNIPESTLRKALDGISQTEGGLVSKVPGLYKEAIDENLEDGGRTRKTYYSFEGTLRIEGLESYFDVVSIREDRVLAEIEQWREDYNHFTNQKSNSFSTIIPESYQNHSGIINNNNLISSTVDRILDNIGKCIKNDIQGFDSACKSVEGLESESVLISLISDEKTDFEKKGQIDSENSLKNTCDSGMIPVCVHMLHSDSAAATRNPEDSENLQPERGPEFFARIAQEWQTKEKASVNSSNLDKFLVYAWMRYGQAGITNLSREALADFARHYFKLSSVNDSEIVIHSTIESARALAEELMREG